MKIGNVTEMKKYTLIWSKYIFQKLSFHIYIAIAIANAYHVAVSKIYMENMCNSMMYKFWASLYKCPRRNVPDFGRMFLILKYADITQNTYVQS
jgi:hypothetical protein